MPQLTRRFHQAGQKPRNHPALACEAKIIELQDRGNAQLEKRAGELPGGLFANGRVGAVAADKDIIEAFAQGEKLVFESSTKCCIRACVDSSMRRMA